MNLELDLVIAYQPDHPTWGPWFARWYPTNRDIEYPYYQTHKTTYNALLTEARKWCNADIAYPIRRVVMMHGPLKLEDHADFLSSNRIITPDMIEIPIDDWYDDAVMAVARLTVA